jgi:hypothetical protein
VLGRENWVRDDESAPIRASRRSVSNAERR